MLAEFQKALVINQKLQVTVWDLTDSDLELHFDSYILDLDPPFVKVAFPRQSNDEIESRMQQGVVVGVILEAYPAPYVFYPMVHHKQEQPHPGYWLKIPENPQLEVMQRRKHVRIPMRVPVDVEFPIGPKWIAIKAHTEDLSGGGMRFTASRQFNKGEKLLIRLKLDDAEGPLRLNANVIFSEENRSKRHPEDLYVTACQFLNLDDLQEMLIMRECFRRELKKPR